MTTNHIRFEPPETDHDAERVAQYILDCQDNAERHLTEPDEVWPNGRSKHEVAREIVAEAIERYARFALKYGYYDAYGRVGAFGARPDLDRDREYEAERQAGGRW